MINMLDHQCLALTTSDDQNWLWHQRYGHPSLRSITMLNLKKIVYGLPQVKLPKQVCMECCVAKQPRKSLNNDMPMELKQKSEIAYLDVCRPFEVKSLGDDCYFRGEITWRLLLFSCFHI
jgi:hypothetical protein